MNALGLDPSLESFLASIVKSRLDLDSRNCIGEIIARTVRDNNVSLWRHITSSLGDYDRPASQLSQDGCISVSHALLAPISSYLRSLPSTGTSNTSEGGRTEVEMLDLVGNNDLIHELACSFPLLKLVCSYLKAPALYYNFNAWWQFPMGKNHTPSNAQLWHRDRDDFRSLALFMYATDVDLYSGPHVYMKRTHTLKGSRSTFNPKSDSHQDIVLGRDHSFIDESMWNLLSPLFPPKIWQGAAGTAFLEDTKGFHKGMIAQSKPRLVFRLNWTLLPSSRIKSFRVRYPSM